MGEQRAKFRIPLDDKKLGAKPWTCSEGRAKRKAKQPPVSRKTKLCLVGSETPALRRRGRLCNVKSWFVVILIAAVAVLTMQILDLWAQGGKNAKWIVFDSDGEKTVVEAERKVLLAQSSPGFFCQPFKQGENFEDLLLCREFRSGRCCRRVSRYAMVDGCS